MNKTRKRLLYLAAISSLVIMSLMIISSVMNIGEKLRRISVYLEIAFYVLVAFVILFFIILPIKKIVGAPDAAIINDPNSDDAKVNKVYKRIAKNIVKNNKLEDRYALMLNEYKDINELKLNLQVVFNDVIKSQLNKIIIKNAKTVLISTAICQNARVDSFTVIAVNTTMIKQLVEKCGFRPTMANLSKLTLNVFTTALIAEGLESLTLDDVLPQSTSNMIGDIPLLKPVLGSVTQGIANALLTIRIGCVTRGYLHKDGSAITNEDMRKQAYKESLLLLPQVLYGTLTFVPKKMVSFMWKKPKESN